MCLKLAKFSDVSANSFTFELPTRRYVPIFEHFLPPLLRDPSQSKRLFLIFYVHNFLSKNLKLKTPIALAAILAHFDNASKLSFAAPAQCLENFFLPLETILLDVAKT